MTHRDDVVPLQKAVAERTSYDIVWLKHLAEEMKEEGLCKS